ncbi:MAG: hypothetical protein D6680_07575 [Cyanobacteria bacterium J007]|nr:MAG: hypothetical protein D6680_07575 [Cyanobacteria bacterium J007]
MNGSLMRRYVQLLNRSKWIAIACFTMSVGGAGIWAFMGLDPLPKYVARGVLVGANPPISFSQTATQILEQGKQLSKEILLADNVLEAVSSRVNETPPTLLERISLRVVNRDGNSALEVYYRDETAQSAQETAQLLMQAMIEQSRLLNQNSLQVVLQNIERQLPEISKELEATRQARDNYTGGDAEERQKLEKRVELKQQQLDRVREAAVDAEAAQEEIGSSLAIAQMPQVGAVPDSNRQFFLISGAGAIAGAIVGGGVVPLLAWWWNRRESPAFRTKLLAAYNSRCPLTGCEVEAAIDAVRLDRDRAAGAKDLENGLILRADLHNLFNQNLLAIDPKTLTVAIAPELAQTSYGKLAGRRLELPSDEEARPNLELLERQYRRCSWIDLKGEESP